MSTTVRIADEFTVSCPPEQVFAYMVDPENLARWQTIKTSVTPLGDGPPRRGYRVREGNRVGPRRWDQVVEFTEFEPGSAFAVRVVEGPASDGRWTFSPDGRGTRVHFTAGFEAPRVLAPLVKRVIRRQFRGYHRNLTAALGGE